VTNRLAQLLVLSSFSALCACASLPVAPADALPVQEVRANSAKYDGKEVTVIGFATVESENDSLWADASAADELDQAKCVGLGIPDEYYNRKLHGKWLALHGTLKVFSKNSISLNACSGVALSLLGPPVRIAKP
jgi:hypothetical protein